MSEQGAALQKYNQELVKCLESLKCKRAELLDTIEKEQEERDMLEASVNDLKKKLGSLNVSLASKCDCKANYDKIIEETESVYMKILESSQILLNKVRQESVHLEQC